MAARHHVEEGRVGDVSKGLEDLKREALEYSPRPSRPRGEEGIGCQAGSCPLGIARCCRLTQDDLWVTSWKEISRYTGLGISTLIRAARRGDFPVKKLGTKGGYVSVRKADLDAWREGRNAFGERSDDKGMT